MERPEDHFTCPELADSVRQGQRHCPDCGGPLSRRTSRHKGLLYTEIWYQCTNVICAATFKGYEEIVYRLKVPVPTNPLIKLPVSPSLRNPNPPISLKRREPDPLDGCPECGARIWKQLEPTRDPHVFYAYAECSSGACKWAVSAPVELKPTAKAEPT